MVHAALHDFDQGGFIAGRCGQAFWLGNRSHTGMIMAQWDFVMALRREDEWVWGWDSTPGIVSVWANEGRASVWRRIPKTGELIREETRFRPWLVLDRLDDLQHLGDRLGPADCETDLRIVNWTVRVLCATWSPLRTGER
jgi:hypothetical protein